MGCARDRPSARRAGRPRSRRRTSRARSGRSRRPAPPRPRRPRPRSRSWCARPGPSGRIVGVEAPRAGGRVLSVGMGFIAIRTTIVSPFVMPPSIPPARLVRRRNDESSYSSSSCTCEPRSEALSNASPISTPFIAWIPSMRAPPRRASRRGAPRCASRAGGQRRRTRISMMPPSVSRLVAAASMAASMRFSASGFPRHVSARVGAAREGIGIARSGRRWLRRRR